MITLKPITWELGHAVEKLRVHESQENYVASNLWSLAQAFLYSTENDHPPIIFAICNDKDEPVGFTMTGYWEENEYQNDDEPLYYLWRFMIDKKHQGKGYGKAAMVEILKHIRTMPLGKASSIYLSYEPENEVAKKLYASLGFVETGEIKDGEAVARLPM